MYFDDEVKKETKPERRGRKRERCMGMCEELDQRNQEWGKGIGGGD